MDVVATPIRIALLAAHLMATNLATAGPLVCIWLRFRARRGEIAAEALGRRLARLSLWSLLIGIALGLLLLALFWVINDQRYWAAVRRFPPQAYWYAAIELVFTAACYALYVAMWERWRSRPWIHGAVAVLGTTNLVYHLPPLMIALGELAARPHWVQEPAITRPVFRDLMIRPELFGMLLHYLVASAAVGGVALMFVAYHRSRAHSEDREIARYTAAGARISLIATLAQLAVGAWLLVQLPSRTRDALIGDDWISSSLFLLSLFVAAGAVQLLIRIAGGETRGELVRRGTILLMFVVVLMAAAQMRSRHVAASIAGFRALLEQGTTNESTSHPHS